MKFLAAALVLFIGVSGDLALASAANSASAATAHSTQSLSATHLHHVVTVTHTVHPDPFVWSH